MFTWAYQDYVQFYRLVPQTKTIIDALRERLDDVRQIETLFDELEYIELRLKILGLVGSAKEQNAKAIDYTS